MTAIIEAAFQKFEKEQGINEHYDTFSAGWCACNERYADVRSPALINEVLALKYKMKTALEEIGVPNSMVSGEKSIEILRKLYEEL